MRKILVFLFVITSLVAVSLGFYANHQALAITTEMGEVANLGEYITKIFDWIIGIAAGMAVLMMVYAGYLYMTSQGNPDNIKQAKDIIIGVIMGIILLFLIEVILVKTIGVQF